MRRATRAVAGLLAPIAVACGAGSGSPQVADRPVATASASASAAPVADAAPTRHYEKGDTATLVVQEGGPFQEGLALSPDGALLALAPQHGASIAVYDLDRSQFVGRFAAPDGWRDFALSFADDNTLLAKSYSTLTAYDLSTSTRIGELATETSGVVSTVNGLAALTCQSENLVGTLTLLKTGVALAEIPCDFAREIVDLDEERFAVVESARVSAFRASGEALWTWSPDPTCSRGIKASWSIPDAGLLIVVCEEEPKDSARKSYRWVALGAADGAETARGAADLFAKTRTGLVFTRGSELHRWVADGHTEVVLADDAAGDRLSASPSGRTVSWTVGDKTFVFDERTGARRHTSGALTVLFDERDHPRLGLGADTLYRVIESKAAADLVTTPLFSLQSSGRRTVAFTEAPLGFAGTCENDQVAVLDPNDSAATAPTPVAPAPSTAELDVASPDGRYRARTVEDPSGSVWPVVIFGNREAITVDAGGPVQRLEFHPNGRYLLTAAHLLMSGNGYHVDEHATVRVFDVQTGALKKKFAAESFSFTGKRLVLGSAEDVKLLDRDTFKVLRTWKNRYTNVSVSPDDRYAVVSTYAIPEIGMGPVEWASTRLEDLSTGKSVLDLPESVFTFSSSGALFAASAQDLYRGSPFVSLYDLQSSKVRAVDNVRVAGGVVTFEFVSGDAVLAISTEERSVFHRLRDAGELFVEPVSVGAGCRLIAYDERGRYQGAGAGALAIRWGSNLRTSALEPAGAADSSLVTDFFGGLGSPPR
ncbi:MAG: WD40 repeat domain-containing protein [Polyangiaceae bacterium]